MVVTDDDGRFVSVTDDAVFDVLADFEGVLFKVSLSLLGEFLPLFRGVFPFFGESLRLFRGVFPFFGETPCFFGGVFPFFGESLRLFRGVFPFLGGLLRLFGELLHFLGELLFFFAELLPLFDELSPLFVGVWSFLKQDMKRAALTPNLFLMQDLNFPKLNNHKADANYNLRFLCV